MRLRAPVLFSRLGSQLRHLTRQVSECECVCEHCLTPFLCVSVCVVVVMAGGGTQRAVIQPLRATGVRGTDPCPSADGVRAGNRVCERCHGAHGTVDWTSVLTRVLP